MYLNLQSQQAHEARRGIRVPTQCHSCLEKGLRTTPFSDGYLGGGFQKDFTFCVFTFLNCNVLCLLYFEFFTCMN